jgi:hypothetical protein
MLTSFRVKACSVNPIDTKVRKGTYDDAPGNDHTSLFLEGLSCLSNIDYYKFVPKDFHIIGFDGAGTVLEVGPRCTNFKPGDDVFYVSSTTRQGSAAEYLLVDERHCAEKPKSLDFVEIASMGLTFGTAYQSLIDRLEIKQNENVGILIVSFTKALSQRCSGYYYLGCLSNTHLTVLDQWRRWSWKCCDPNREESSAAARGNCNCIPT